MAQGKRRDPQREAMWREVLTRHGRSGLGVRAFCQQQRLPESSFHAWRRTIRQRDAARQARRSSPPPMFVPLVVPPEDAAGDGQIIVELRGGRVLRLPRSMPAAQLAAVVHAIEGAA